MGNIIRTNTDSYGSSAFLGDSPAHINTEEDIIKLTFDEENQVIKAKIINPSQHTRYLFMQGRLGIDLSKRITTRQKGTKFKNSYGSNYKDVKRSYRGRGVRVFAYHNTVADCGTCQPVNDLNATFEFPIRNIGTNTGNNPYAYDGFQAIMPMPIKSIKRTGTGTNSYGFTTIKAVLVTRTKYHQNNSNSGSVERAYKVRSDAIKLRKTPYTEKVALYFSRMPKMDITCTKVNDTTVSISISNLNDVAQQLFDAGKLYICTSYDDTAGKWQEGGFRNKERGTGHKNENVRGKKVFFNNSNHWIPYADSINRGEQNNNGKIINSLNFNYTIYECVPPGISKLIRLVNSPRHDHNPPMIITRDVYVVIGYAHCEIPLDENAGIYDRYWQSNLYRFSTGITRTGDNRDFFQ